MGKRATFLVLLASFATIFGAKTDLAQVVSPVEHVRQIVSQVKEMYCPDHRVDIFDVAVETLGDTIVLKGETTNRVAWSVLLKQVHALLGDNPVRNEIVVLPDSSVGRQSWALVTVSVANQRRRPSHSAELLNQMLLGTPLRIYKTKPPWWFFVRSEEGYLGWTDDGGIWLTDSLGVARWRASKRVIVLAKEAEVLSKAESGAVPVSDVVVGDLLQLKRRDGHWLQVALPDGRSGWLREELAMPFTAFLRHANPSADKIVRDALQFMGRPYLWGGKSSKGMDCSGYTSVVFRMSGILLPRDANMQAKVGAEVPIDSSFSALKPGDLVFFGPSPRRITHVGIYIGDKRYIHSDSHIHVNSFDPGAPNFSGYRRKAFRRARRILGNLERDPATGWWLPKGMRRPGLFGEAVPLN